MVVLLAHFFCLSSACSGSTKPALHFYIPESNINNFALLKDEFDSYLIATAAFEFHPFSSRALFEQHFTNLDGIAFLVSSWYFRELKKDFSIDPILIGIAKGKSTQKYYLCKRGPIIEEEVIHGAKIASATNRTFTINVLQEILSLPNTEPISTVRIIFVPKDIDALMSIEFGIVDYAIVAAPSLEDYARISPDEHALLTRAPTRGDWLLPIVGVPHADNKETLALIQLMEEMSNTSAGAMVLNLINLEGFKRIDDDDRKMLEK